MLPREPRQRSLLFREVNDRIYELLEETDPDLPGEFLCECGRDCGRRVELLPAAFAMLREAGGVVGRRTARPAAFLSELQVATAASSRPARAGGRLGVEVVEPRRVDGEP